MSHKKVKGLFIGLNTIDMQFIVDKYPGQNEKAKATDYGLHTGGPATNAAITFNHLGGECNLLSSFGKHPLTQLIYDDLHQLNVQTSDLTPDRSCHPVFASIITSKTTGERSIVSYHPEYQNYCDITLENFSLDSLDIILTDSFYTDAAKILIKRAHDSMPVVMDGGSWKKDLDKLLPYVDIAICSNDFYPPNTNSDTEVIDYLSKMGIKKIAITKGNQPILVSNENSITEIPVKEINPVDTLGAGDIFHGAFCYYYSLSNKFHESLEKASEIAAKSCMHYGTRSWMEKIIQ